MNRVRRLGGGLVVLFISPLFLLSALSQPVEPQGTGQTHRIVLSEPEDESHGVLDHAVWYIPNRFMDIVDIFRLRLSVGPGLGVNARITDYAAFYGGTQHSVYLGLPGPRKGQDLRLPVGFEHKRGIVLAGVDASDDLPHPPDYGMAEVNAGLHLGIVGVDLGIDPWEIADFIAGLVFIDLIHDDFPTLPTPGEPEIGSMIAVEWVNPKFPASVKPSAFTSTTERLDYLHTNVPIRLQGGMQFVDTALADPTDEPIPQPSPTDLEFAFYVRSIVGGKTEIEFKPDFSLDVELPNLEQKIELFIESSSDDDLPGRDALDKQDKGWTVGARKESKDYNISTDAGVRARWLPEVYGRVNWRPSWEWEDWVFNFEQRFYWESKDGFGTLTSLRTLRWLNNMSWIFKNTLSGRIDEESNGYEWQETIGIGKVTKLLDERKRIKNRAVVDKDAISGYSVNLTFFGSDDDVTTVRVLAAKRWSMYQDFVIGEFRAGPQWRNVEDWDTEFRTDFGLIFEF